MIVRSIRLRRKRIPEKHKGVGVILLFTGERGALESDFDPQPPGHTPVSNASKVHMYQFSASLPPPPLRRITIIRDGSCMYIYKYCGVCNGVTGMIKRSGVMIWKGVVLHIGFAVSNLVRKGVERLFRRYHMSAIIVRRIIDDCIRRGVDRPRVVRCCSYIIMYMYT